MIPRDLKTCTVRHKNNMKSKTQFGLGLAALVASLLGYWRSVVTQAHN